MRAFIVVCLLVAGASAQLSTSTLSKAKNGCDFGAPGDTWVKVPCNEAVEEAKMIALGEGAEFLGSTRMTAIRGAHVYAIHGKVNGRCCSQRVSRMAGTGKQHSFKLSEDGLCCYETCPEWMTC